MKPPRIPGKKVVFLNGRPVVMSDAQVRELFADVKRKPKLKRAADRAWEAEGKKRGEKKE